MSRCCAKTTKGTRCQLGVCDESECGLCSMHHKKYENDPDSVAFFPTKTQSKSTDSGIGSGNRGRDPDDDETSWNTNELYDTALNLVPEVDVCDVMMTNVATSSNDVWGSIAANFNSPIFTLPNKKQKTPKKRLTPKLLLNLSLWMFYRDCCKTTNINNVIKNQIIREGLVKGSMLATKDKVVEENGVSKVIKTEIIPYQLVKHATDQVWQKLPEAMRQRYFQAVRDDYSRRENS